jgi:hypothetical protein
MSWLSFMLEQIKAFLLEQLEEDGGLERAKREVTSSATLLQ